MTTLTSAPAVHALQPARALSLLAVATLIALPARAEDITHIIRQGDTLEQLARAYLGETQRWPLLQAHNQVRDPRRLQPGGTIRIPWSALPESSAQVSHVEGPAQWQATAVRPGDRVTEGSVLDVPQESHVSVELADGTVVRIQGPAQVDWKHLRKQARSGSAQSQLELHQGRMEASVPPRPKAPARFEVRTPLGTTSVRGTHFDLQIQPSGEEQTTVLEGRVQSQAADQVQIAAGQGLRRTADGQSQGVVELLPPPAWTPLPVQTDAQWLTLALPPLPDGAVAYHVSIWSTGQSEHVLRQQITPQPQARWPAVPDGQYTARLRAVDAQGLAGKPAQQPLTVKAHPIPPLLQSPAHASVQPAGAVALRCSTSSEASHYLFELAADAHFQQPVQQERTPSCTWTTPPLSPGQYFWRVASLKARAGLTDDQGPYGVMQSFTVRERPPQPDLQQLQTQTEGTLRLRWQGTEGMRYRIQVAADEQFRHVLADSWLTEPQWHPDSWPRGTYFARLQQQDASGLESPFSAAWRFDWEGDGVRTGTGNALLLQDQRQVERARE